MTMTRQELWTLSYKTKPYLSHLSVDQLARRLQDVMANLTTLTPEGKIGMDSTEEPGRHPWLKLSPTSWKNSARAKLVWHPTSSIARRFHSQALPPPQRAFWKPRA